MAVASKPIHYDDENFDPRQVNILLAKELNKISFNRRGRINEEIHGVCCLAPEETPELLDAALGKLSLALDQIPCAEKQAFLQSQQLYPNNRYVNDRSFRLMFLRCELFDVRKAAIRLVRHLDFLLEIFDNKKELLGRQIRMKDLGPRSMKLLRSGCLQLLPVRDSSGRRVFVVTSFKSNFEVVDRIRLYYYFQAVLSEDVDSQRKGVVSVALAGENVGAITQLPSKIDRYKLARFILSAPVRYCSIHSCYPDSPLFRLVKAAYSMGLHSSDSTRFRLKFHTGTEIENRYKLMSYGIPVDHLPITNSGKVKSGGLNQWLNVRTRIENQRIENGEIIMGDFSTNIIECPSLNDVAIRPGKSSLCHPGNVWFKELLDKHMDDHAAADRRGKDIISWSIIEEIEHANGRFLEWDNNGGLWIENKDRKSIRTRIPIYFRDHKRNTRVKRKQIQKALGAASFQTNDSHGSTNPLQSYYKKRKTIVDENTECNIKFCVTTVFDD